MSVSGLLKERISTRQVLRLPTVSDLLPCLLLILSSRASVLELFPFGVAMFCAVFDKSLAYIGVAVVCIATMSAGVGTWFIKYSMATLLFWLYTRLREDYKEVNILSSAVAGACMFIGGCITMIYQMGGTYDFLMLFIESILCSFSYIIFCKATEVVSYNRAKPTEQELISGAICVGIFITGLSDVYLPFGINISRCLTVYIVMSIALHESLAIAGSGGLAAGLICSMNDLAAVTLMGLYGLCALFGNLLNTFGKYGVALGFLGGAAITLLYVGNSFFIPLSLTEIIISVLLFILTPNRIHNIIGNFFKRTLHVDIVPADIRMKEYMYSILTKNSNAFKSLEKSFKAVSDKRIKMYKKDVCTIFDTVTERVCSTCSKSECCWGDEFHNTYRMVFTLLSTMETEGFCSTENISREFKNHCERYDYFIMEFNHAYELYKGNVIKDGEALENRDLILSQYKEISDLMERMANTVKGGFRFLEDVEEKIAEDLEKSGMYTREISVIEGGQGDIEVYLSLNKQADKEKIEEKLTDILKTPIGYECTYTGGLLKFISKGIYDAEFAYKQIPKDGQTICGDNIVSFKTSDYKFYVIICDGMGSGKEASKESYMAGSLLEEFLKAGLSAKASINMINSSLALKLDRESFSSIDLLSIDLMTGQAEFYKIGSTKSYIKRGDDVETIFTENLPAGILNNVHIKGISKKLMEDDIIIMMSDGVSESGFGVLSNERIKKMLKKDNKTPAEMVSTVLSSAMRNNDIGAKDDMTVAVIKINLIN